MDDVSVFRLDPEAVAWLATTFDPPTPQHALLKALALSAEANAQGRSAATTADGERPARLADLLSDDEVSVIVASVSAVFPALPIPSTPGPSQLLAIDEVIHRGAQRPEADVTWTP